MERRGNLDNYSSKACQNRALSYGQRHCLLTIVGRISSLSMTINLLTQQISVGLSYPEPFAFVEVLCSHAVLVLENSQCS
ncbi:hypothetical protein V6N12_065022 [Hibiscus sabdariffa]|uniref:Uncharacterized protein n=1 Tax=Hibiscus sabdariffa TaxID=183260 RepID=A0ABR2G7H1_9ROSI